MSKTFNEYYINIVQTTTGTTYVNTTQAQNLTWIMMLVVEEIIKTYENHPSIKLSKDKFFQVMKTLS